MRSSLKVALALALFAAGFSFSLSRNQKGPQAPTRELASVPAGGLVSSNPVREGVGEELLYDFKREIRSDLIEQQKKKPFVNLKYQGRMRVSKVRLSDQTEWLKLNYELHFQDQPQTFASTLPVLVQIGEDRKLRSIRSIEAHSKAEQDELNLFRDFISIYAYRTEEDTTGAYRATWISKADGGLKHKVSYLGRYQNTLKILKSHHEVLLSKVGQIEEINGTDLTVMSGEWGSGLSTFSHYEVRLVGVTSSKGQGQKFASLGSISLGLESAPGIQSARKFESLAPLLKGLSKMNRTERLSLFHEYVNALRVDPSRVDEFKKQVELMKNQMGSLEFGVGVLATLQIPAAQVALLDWYRRMGSGKPELRHTILNALATTDAELTLETRNFLMEAASAQVPGLSENAAFALGSSLKKVSDPSVEAKLESLFREARESGARESVLDAMGNSGDVKFAPILMQTLQSESAGEREKAAFAARLMKSQDALPILSRAFQDADPRVKLASIRALQFQTDLKPYAGMIQSCAAEGNSSCRTYLNRI